MASAQHPAPSPTPGTLNSSSAGSASFPPGWPTRPSLHAVTSPASARSVAAPQQGPSAAGYRTTSGGRCPPSVWARWYASLTRESSAARGTPSPPSWPSSHNGALSHTPQEAAGDVSPVAGCRLARSLRRKRIKTPPTRVLVLDTANGSLAPAPGAQARTHARNTHVTRARTQGQRSAARRAKPSRRGVPGGLTCRAL